MIGRCSRLALDKAVIFTELTHFLLRASTSALQLQQWRGFARQRKRLKFVDPIAIKKTETNKRIVEFYKDMTPRELANALDEPYDDVVECIVSLDKSNLEAAASDAPLDREYSAKAITAFNCKPKLVLRVVKEKEEGDDLLPQDAAPSSECLPRTPVVTIMGHVDHGKTTLLDSLRNSRIVDGEFGGITQHIGAFSVFLPSMKRSVTFLDTPGHAAFSNMRSRGASVTDIVVLVVAADDGVKEQTEQSIKFAREAGVPIVVAINKCDKPTADPARSKRSLLQHDIVVEELGGDVQCVEISALQGKNLDALQEAILTQADLLDLRAPIGGRVEGHVLESSVEHGLGKVCTVLVSRGSLRKGRTLVAGTAYTRVRTMNDESGREVEEAKPGMPVRISGWKDTLPSPGDMVLEAPDSTRAEKAIKWRVKREMDEKAQKDWAETEDSRQEHREKYLEMRQHMLNRGQRFGSTLRHIAHKRQQLRKSVDDGKPKLRIILRTDVEGSLEAILDVIDTYSSDKCDFQLVDFGVGPLNAKDIEMASSTNALLYTFNLSTSPSVRKSAADEGIEIRPFNVVYRLVDGLKEDLSNCLPEDRERVLVGQGHVLKEFLISDRNRKKQPIAGVLVDWGDFQRNCIFRFSRGGEVYYEGNVESMKRDQEVVSSSKTNTEVGLALEDKKIRFKEDDSIEVYEEKKVKKEIDWFPPGF